MTAKKKTEIIPVPDLYRLAEVLQMRRVNNYSVPNTQPYYECQLCLGRSAPARLPSTPGRGEGALADGSALGEIKHTDGCPLNRLK